MIDEILKLNGYDGADLHIRLAAEGFGMILDNPYNPNTKFEQMERNNRAIQKVWADYMLKSND